MQSIFNRLEKLRTKADLTWDQLAKEIGLSVSMLMQTRRGDRNLSLRANERLRNLETAAGIEPPYEPSHALDTRYALHEVAAAPVKKEAITKLRRQVQNIQLQIDAITETLDELEK